MSVTSNLAQVKINAGGVGPFAASLKTLNPELSGCGTRALYDQYGRPAPLDSIDSQSCPGLYSSSNRIEVENSLRSFLSPQYFNLPEGISGAYSSTAQGADTLFGNSTSSRRTNSEYSGITGGVKSAQGLINTANLQ
jgi:hypothetical protein